MTDLRPVVFLGPTLGVSQAREIAPDIRPCRPVRCGDVLALLRVVAAPTPIALIDGVFEHVGATWHKELLFAMQSGHPVFGASSMGALRAAELADLGMIGVGRVFEDYYRGVIADDDEVAVLHASSIVGHQALTDPMVNIRSTMERAVAEDVVSQAVADEVLRRAKSVFFHERVLTSVVETLEAPHRDRLAAWLPDGYVDQKRRDAAALLERLAAPQEPPPVAPTLPAEAIGSAFLRTLQAYVACRPIPFGADWLPAEERLARVARLWGVRYLLLRDLALARAFAHGAGVGDEPVSQEAETMTLGVILREYGVYEAFVAGHQSDELESTATIASALAQTWCRLEARLTRRGHRFEPGPADVRRYAAGMARELGLTGPSEVKAWRARNHLAAPGSFPAFLVASMKRRQCLSPGAGDALGIASIDPRRPWLYEAIVDTGVATEIERTLAGEGLSRLTAQWSALPGDHREGLANACDLDGYDEVLAELKRLAR